MEKVRDWPEGEPLLAMTAYDVIFARLADEGGADILHVGDTLAITVLGYGSTTAASMEDMIRHTGAVARGRRRALITADLPYGAYENETAAVDNARRLLEAGADAVKLEGGLSARRQVEALREAGIEVQGHIGLLPQFAEGKDRFRKKGRTREEAEGLLADAQFLEAVGVFSVVIENVVATVAGEITRALRVPTLGIAAGSETSGQIVVTPEVLGLKDWEVPPFVRPVARLGAMVREGVLQLKGGMGSA